MNNSFLCFLLIILISFAISSSLNASPFKNYVAPFASPAHSNWWTRPNASHYGFPAFSYWQEENFENLLDRPSSLKPEESPVLEFPPNTPNSADVYNEHPYHLLNDLYPPPRTQETISCVNSRSCYATDFNRLISKTGTYRQLTNNYKRDYPDSCSSPYQELVLNFYKTSPFDVPKNNTGYSVSEAVSL
jgi:hypothetical protein